MRILVVLQNPYAKGSLSQGWNPSRWRKEFESSRSGQRLRDAFPYYCDLFYTNANPKLGDSPDSKLEADPKHLKRSVRRTNPDLIITCGKVAEAAILNIWDGPLIAIPHPAHRLLTNRLLDECKECIAAWRLYRRSPTIRGLGTFYQPMMTMTPRIALRQGRGRINMDVFEGKRQVRHKVHITFKK
jgi:hypothetical protein